MRALLVEDDEMLGSGLRQGLEDAGWSVDWVKDGEHAGTALVDGDYSCVLLDLGLPRRGGVTLLEKFRAGGGRTPVIVITARDGDLSCVLTLDLGADDFLQKPFKLSVLLARMRAVIRRRSGSARSLIGLPGLLLDLDTREAVLSDQRVTLTAREFTILAALLERPGAILSRAQIENRVYGWDDAIASNAVDVAIHGMRKKLGPDAIRNVRGLGWRVGAS